MRVNCSFIDKTIFESNPKFKSKYEKQTELKENFNSSFLKFHVWNERAKTFTQKKYK